jgi:hypothetical protein
MPQGMDRRAYSEYISWLKCDISIMVSIFIISNEMCLHDEFMFNVTARAPNRYNHKKNRKIL